jgi:hypothetical protein
MLQSNRASTGGRVWPQYLEQYAGVKSYDYAVSGAVCDATHALNQRNGILQNQLPTFLSNKAYKNTTTGKPILNIPKSETVYAVWIGTNDLGNGVFLGERQPKGVPVTAYTDCVYAQLDRLYESGARYFVILNNGPLDLIPQYALPENDGVTWSRFWTDKLQYNANITQTSEKMRAYVDFANEIFTYKTGFEVQVNKRYRGSRFAVFDTQSFVSDVLYNSRLGGRTDIASDGRYLAQSGNLPQWHGAAQRDFLGSAVRCGLRSLGHPRQLHVVR